MICCATSSFSCCIEHRVRMSSTLGRDALLRSNLERIRRALRDCLDSLVQVSEISTRASTMDYLALLVLCF